jgi:PAS domain S-box-containing protein
MPFLLFLTVMHIGLHYYLTTKYRWGIDSAQGSSILLAGSFSFHMSSELIKIVSIPGYATEGGYSILRVGFFSVIGLIAAGGFKKKIDMNEALEAIVRERTAKITKQAEELCMVEHALQASETSIAIADSDQRIVWCNAALERLTGLQKSRLQNRSLVDVLDVPASDNDKLPKFFETGISTETCFATHGKFVSAEISRFPCKEDGDKNHFLVVLKDLTAEKACQDAEKAGAKKAMVAQAMEESMQTLSHELRTPLQGIMGMTSLILREINLDEDVKDCMTMVMTSARLLLTLINNLLDIQKLDANMLDEFVLSPIDLEASLRAAVDFCMPCATITSVGFNLNLENELSDILVESNELRLQQVLINLFSNAIKYTAEGTDVMVTMSTMALEQVESMASGAIQGGPRQSAWDSYEATRRKALPMAVVSVSDQGAGFTGRNMPNIFEKFTHLDTKPVRALGGTATGQAGGTGLGLNLCVKFLQKMKGRIWATNNAGRGSTFSFAIPLSECNQLDTKPKRVPSVCSKSPRLLPQKVTNGSKFRVLVVDDIIINLKVVTRMLKSLGIENIGTASCGSQALKSLMEEDYNIVLSDLQMPEMSGTELSIAIHQSSLPVKPAVIAFTADTDDSVAEKCRRAGMQSVLHKPLTADQLLRFFETFEGLVAQ